MDQMMNLQLAKQHREERLREVELNRQAKALRAAGKGRAGRRSALVWEMKWHAGRLLKLLGTLKNAG
jgi:single-stranded DNA-specific DHH superfamily exonuclease